MVLYESCPEQLNGFDCEILAVTVYLHLSEQKSVNRSSFLQENNEDKLWMEDVVGVLAEGQAHPNEFGINQVFTLSKAEDSTLTAAASSDTNLYKVMKDANVDSFAEMDPINPIVPSMGNFASISAINCPFEIRFARRRSDGMYVVSRMKTYHADVCHAPLAAIGRKWKTLCSSKNFNNAIVKVLKTKHDNVRACDITKTMANKKTICKAFLTSQHGVPSIATPWQPSDWAARAFSWLDRTLRSLQSQIQGRCLGAHVCKPMSFRAFTSFQDL